MNDATDGFRVPRNFFVTLELPCLLDVVVELFGLHHSAEQVVSLELLDSLFDLVLIHQEFWWHTLRRVLLRASDLRSIDFCCHG